MLCEGALRTTFQDGRTVTPMPGISSKWPCDAHSWRLTHDEARPNIVAEIAGGAAMKPEQVLRHRPIGLAEAQRAEYFEKGYLVPPTTCRSGGSSGFAPR